MENTGYYLLLPFALTLPVFVFFAGITVGRWLTSTRHKYVSRRLKRQTTSQQLGDCVWNLSTSIDAYSTQMDEALEPLKDSTDLGEIKKAVSTLLTLSAEFRNNVRNECDELQCVVQKATLSEVSKNAPTPDRRKSTRHPYPYTQQIAFYDGEQIPPLDEFFDVRCHDISADGISFVMERPLTDQQIIITLGQPPSVKYMKARTRNVIEHSPTEYRIGCQFTGRLSKHDVLNNRPCEVFVN